MDELVDHESTDLGFCLRTFIFASQLLDLPCSFSFLLFKVTPEEESNYWKTTKFYFN